MSAHDARSAFPPSRVHLVWLNGITFQRALSDVSAKLKRMEERLPYRFESR